MHNQLITCMHTYMLTFIHANTYTHTHTIRTYTHACIHEDRQTDSRKDIQNDRKKVRRAKEGRQTE